MKHCAFGYAFVNLTRPWVARSVRRRLSGLAFEGAMLHTGWAEVQGLEKQVERYRDSPVMCLAAA